MDFIKSKFNLEIKCESLREDSKRDPAVIEESTNMTSELWTADTLPETKYMKDKDYKSLSIAEHLSKLDYSKIRPAKLVKLLHAIDLDLIGKITAQDLIEYDGKKIPKTISHAQNRNKGLLNWMIKEFDTRYIFKMMKEASLIKNYNIMNVCMKAIQGNSLSNRKIERLTEYKQILDSQEGGIFPFEWMFKDCSDSNLNVESEIASMRFCKIIEKLKEMKLIKQELLVKERHKHFIFCKCWIHLNIRVIAYEEDQSYHRGLFLVL